MYKMILLDIDGTLVGNSKIMTPNIVSTVKALAKTGVKVCLCTGRNLCASRSIANELELDSYIVTIDGTTVYSISEDKTVYTNCLNYETNKKIFERFNYGLKISVAAADHEFVYYCEKKDYIEEFFSKSLTRDERNAYVKYWNINVTDSLDVYLNTLLNAREISFRSRCLDDLLKMKSILETENFGEELHVRHLWDDMLLVGAVGISKAKGMEFLCKTYGIDVSEVVAIGDERNDIPMLEEAGLGIAMGNARDEVKAAADFVTLSVDEDGAACAINKFFG